jgi:hypothetical protein
MDQLNAFESLRHTNDNRAIKNGKYLENDEENITKTNSNEKNELFSDEDNSDGTFSIICTCDNASFISHSNNIYTTVDDQDNSLKTNLELEKFYVIKNFDGTVSFKDMEGKKNIIIGANDFIIKTERKDGAKFYPISNYDLTVSFKTKQGNKYMIVEKDSIKLAERKDGAKFYPINNSDNTVSFKTKQCNKYMVVEIDSIKLAEDVAKFYPIKNYDGTVSFKDKEGKKYIIVENDSIKLAERKDGAKFYQINNPDDTISFQLSEEKYISVSDNKSLLIVKAVENSINERFFLYSGIFLYDI